MKLGYYKNILILLSVIVLIGCRRDSKQDSVEVAELALKPNILFIFDQPIFTQIFVGGETSHRLWE